MGQQHRKVAKRRRRTAYLERKKIKAKSTASPAARRETPKAKGRKQAAVASAE
jgi:hypothetical protein